MACHLIYDRQTLRQSSTPTMHGPYLSLQLHLAFLSSSRSPLGRHGLFIVHHTFWVCTQVTGTSYLLCPEYVSLPLLFSNHSSFRFYPSITSSERTNVLNVDASEIHTYPLQHFSYLQSYIFCIIFGSVSILPTRLSYMRVSKVLSVHYCIFSTKHSVSNDIGVWSQA